MEFDERGELILPDADVSQHSKFYSQFSPLDQSSASSGKAPLINLDIQHSPSQMSLGIAPPFDQDATNQFDEDIPPMFGDEELPFADLGLTIDADGNFVEEPELPPHPVQQVQQDDEPVAKKIRSDAHLPDDDAPVIFEDDEFPVIFDDEEQQKIPVAPQIEIQNDENEVRLPSEEPLSSDPAEQEPARPRQPKKRKHGAISADETTHVSRVEFRDWNAGYINRIKEAQDAPHSVHFTKAKKNAYNLVFGMGIGNVGIFHGILAPDHELADLFAGENLMERVLGLGEEDSVAVQGNRRRSASVAFESEEEDGGDDRRVRPRVEEEAVDVAREHDQQAGQQDAQILDDDAMVVFDDEQDLLPEAGRERAGSALSDHRRSSNAPWNRPPSAVPSSAAKNAETGRHAVEGSPLVGRGSILQPSDAKFSEGVAPAFGSEGFAPVQSDGANDLYSYSEFGAAAGVSTQEANTSQFMRQALDREGRNFLGFVEGVAADRGQQDAEDENLRWVDFDGLFEAQDKTKAVVAQAFLHVLTLATKNQIKVAQDGVEDQVPWGEIRVGVAAHAEQADEADDMDDANNVDDVDNVDDLQEYEDHDNAE